ncbi:putative ribonuclease H protein [Sesbania bispinosa]|nr:putative ribonuclease H protein [Sesbania bispinosa]
MVADLSLEETKIWVKHHWTQDPTYFASILWHVWISRNAKSIAGDIVDVRKSVWDIRRMTIDIIHAFQGSGDNDNHYRLVGWEPPPPNFLALNTDGSAFGCLGKARFGGLSRQLWKLEDGIHWKYWDVR